MWRDLRQLDRISTRSVQPESDAHVVTTFLSSTAPSAVPTLIRDGAFQWRKAAGHFCATVALRWRLWTVSGMKVAKSPSVVHYAPCFDSEVGHSSLSLMAALLQPSESKALTGREVTMGTGRQLSLEGCTVKSPWRLACELVSRCIPIHLLTSSSRGTEEEQRCGLYEDEGKNDVLGSNSDFIK